MEKLDAQTKPIGVLLSQQFFFRVPEYQRPFSWDSDNFYDLINDIIEARKDQEYFLGTVVLHHREKEGHYDVVDGQQRLTSIMILLACLRDLVEEQSFKDGIQMKILQQKNVVDGIPEKVRLEVKDRPFFNEIVVAANGTLTKRSEAEVPEPEWRYINAVNVFREKLSPLSQDSLKNIIQFLNQRCIVIYLSTSVFEDAFRLFTIVNDRGKQLRRIDILKAINIAPDVITKDSIRDRIAQQWEELEKELGESTFESVFHLVRLILLKDKPQGDLLKEFEDRIFAKSAVIKGEQFFGLIYRYAKLYMQLFVDRDLIQEGNKYRSLIHIMDAEFSASEWRACLLAYAFKFGPTDLLAFTFLLEKVYLEQWVKGIRKDERFNDYAKILSIIENAKKPTDVLESIKYDEATILDATLRQNIYSESFIKYFLLRLELVTAEHDALHQFTAKSIEHVLPQTPEVSGYWADHHDLSKTKEYVNTLGNLVLLSKSKNSSASNFDFSKKKEAYLKNRMSDYPRSLQVLAYKDWDRQTIEERTAQARSLLLRDL